MLVLFQYLSGLALISLLCIADSCLQIVSGEQTLDRFIYLMCKRIIMVQVLFLVELESTWVHEVC